MGSEHDNRSLRRLALTGVFWTAAVGILLTTASLMVGHWVILPSPSKDHPRLLAGLEQLRREDGAERQWFAVHVLYADCGCSKRVLRHLFDSERPTGAREHVLLVGRHDEFEAQAREAGVPLSVLEPQELAETYAIESAPLFLVLGPSGSIRYSGGYTERKRGMHIADADILQSLMHSGEVVELPLFGCAVSKQLQDLLDPLGLKYAARD